MKDVEIFCINTSSKKAYPFGTSLMEIAKDLDIQLKNPVCGAIVNNKLKELSSLVVKSKTIEFIDLSHTDGMRMYIRSLMFVLYAAVREVLPDVCLKIQYGISKGYYCELEGLGRAVTDSDISDIRQAMNGLIQKNIPFIKKDLPAKQAIELFNKQNLPNKSRLIEQKGTLYAFAYFLNDLGNYFYGHLLPSTGYIKTFGIVPYFDGILLRVPRLKNIDKLRTFVKQDKLFGIYQEQKEWAEILKVDTVASLNEYALAGRSGHIIKISEALHEKKVAEIANEISNRRDKVKVVLIAGPSASGKTTFSKRLGVQLAVNGMHPYHISLDDYFVDREKTPKDENGDYDFEALEAIDIRFFNEQLQTLFKGGTVELPRFDFTLGKKMFKGDFLHLNENDILVIEGIHGMNPGLLTQINKEDTYRIFISALTQISFDEQNHISTADNRLIRRIIRDSKYRGYTAHETISRWPSVRKGEERNIFPYQEYADIMFNSATIYELGVLKKYVEPLLQSVTENRVEYNEATRLLAFLSYFKPIDDSEIPPTSLIREFLGGSSFAY